MDVSNKAGIPLKLTFVEPGIHGIEKKGVQGPGTAPFVAITTGFVGDLQAPNG